MYLTELFKKNKYYKLNEITEHIQYRKQIDEKIIYNILKKIIDFKEKIYDEYDNLGYIICKNNLYIFQPIHNNDITSPLFYRQPIEVNNKINTDTISENIKSELDKLIDKKIVEPPNIKDITNKLKEKYKVIVSDDKLIRFKLTDNKQVLFNSCIDELQFEEKQVLINSILESKPTKVKWTPGELNDEEIDYFIYEYLKNNLIQKIDGKNVLFNYDKIPEVYMLMDRKNRLQYYDLNDNLIDASLIEKDLLEYIKSLDKKDYDKIFKLDKIYIQPYINYTKKKPNEKDKIKNKNKYKTEIGFRYTYKFFDGAKLSKGVIAGNDPGYTKSLMDRFSELNIDEFSYLKENFNELYEVDTLYAVNKFKIIELVFRIKNYKSDDINYVISNELNDLRFKK